MPPVRKVRVPLRARRVGHSLALFVRADDARRAQIREGQTLHADILTEVPEPFGLLKDLKLGPFERRREDPGRDRI